MAGHYYDSEGNERHDADMRTVKKEGLLISVTTFLDIIAKPGIEKWKIDERLRIAFQLMKDNPDLPFHDFLKLVEMRFSEENNAADLGTLIHAVMEDFVKEGVNKDAAKDFFFAHAAQKIHGFWQSIHEAYNWLLDISEVIGQSEQIIVSKEDKFAGKLDYNGLIYDPKKTKARPGVIDWKSQMIKKPEMLKSGKGLKAPKVRKDSQWLLQMGAYAKEKKAVHGYIGIISTNPLFPCFKTFYYDTEEILQGYKVFRYTQEVFKFMKGM
jgi:hypothetical protein